jgi:hypothetical protein
MRASPAASAPPPFETVQMDSFSGAAVPELDDDTTLPKGPPEPWIADLLRARDARIVQLGADVERLSSEVRRLNAAVSELSQWANRVDARTVARAEPARFADRLPSDPPPHALSTPPGPRQVSRMFLAGCIATILGSTLAAGWLIMTAPVAGSRAGAAEPASPPAVAPVPSAPAARAEPAPEPDPAPAASASATAAPTQSAPAVPLDLDAEGQELLAFEAYLTVSSSVGADVYVHGVRTGRTNERLTTRCGWKNVRLRDGETWLGRSEVVKLPCRAHTRTSLEPR